MKGHAVASIKSLSDGCSRQFAPTALNPLVEHNVIT